LAAHRSSPQASGLPSSALAGAAFHRSLRVSSAIVPCAAYARVSSCFFCAIGHSAWRFVSCLH
jgi:hypothetical protein